MVHGELPLKFWDEVFHATVFIIDYHHYYYDSSKCTALSWGLHHPHTIPKKAPKSSLQMETLTRRESDKMKIQMMTAIVLFGYDQSSISA